MKKNHKRKVQRQKPKQGSKTNEHEKRNCLKSEFKKENSKLKDIIKIYSR
jgi:hypothetical protein